MRIRAIIFDVYGTLLEVSAPPQGADALWERLWRKQMKAAPRLTLAAFSAACDVVIAREHAAARARGIPYPEVFWPEVVTEVLPELAALARSDREDFLFAQAKLWHTVRLPSEAAQSLRAFHDSGLPLGLATNAQPYTLRELDEALTGAGLPRTLFQPQLCFWSFEHGYSKPDPHVFRVLTSRLRAQGIGAREALMVGDRLDNDILPAQAHGWQTWQLGREADGEWAGLRTRVLEATPCHAERAPGGQRFPGSVL
jgi:FMN phosphatase YigB (HAD superfamily)